MAGEPGFEPRQLGFEIHMWNQYATLPPHQIIFSLLSPFTLDYVVQVKSDRSLV